LGAGAVREVARRHHIRPTKSLGQNFLIDPNLARAIAAEAGAVEGDRIVEVGAGLGSLTVALAATGADVLAIEFDRALIPALTEVVGERPNVRVLHADATTLDWPGTLADSEAWILCANLPYNVAVPVIMEVLATAPSVERLVVMVQREVGERLAAVPGDEHYGAVSVKVAYRARAALTRRVPSSVFWPRPSIDSVVVRMNRLASPPVEVDEAVLWRVVDGAFAERRKTIRNALRRLGLSGEDADAILASTGVAASARPEELGLETFAAIASKVPA
jgi:16S rRNA (adenine1518-N6/adenine1519-N6)-dimethyltransferase